LASIELLQKILEIYSPSGKEKPLALFLREELERLGFLNVRIDKVGNVYGEVGSDSPTVLLCGHMDTVPGQVPVSVVGSMLYGRGAVDAKSSLAAMISAASSLELGQRSGKVIVAAVVEEERKAKGIYQLLREGLSIDCAIFGEPSGIKNITFAYRGKLGLNVTFKTMSGHIGAQHLVDNAVEKAFEFWSMLKTSFEGHGSSQGVFYSLTPCLTRISSLRTSGGVPDVCRLDIDLRLPPRVKSEVAIKMVKEVTSIFLRERPVSSVDLKVTDRVEPFVAKRNAPVMKALEEAILEITGGPITFLRKTGTGDMNIFGSATAVPVATYGPGDSRLSHTPNENIDLTEYLTSIQVYGKAVRNILMPHQT